MPGFLPVEGETLIANLLFKLIVTDRDATLELGLFTNTTVTEAITEATITEPTGGSYARKTLTDASWTVANGVASYAALTFTAASTPYSAPIYGYFISTVSAGGTPRLIAVEVDNSGPYTMAANDTYTITPTVTIA